MTETAGPRSTPRGSPGSRRGSRSGSSFAAGTVALMTRYRRGLL